MEAAVLFILVLGLLFLGVPIAISLGLSSVLTIAFFSNDSVSSVALQLQFVHIFFCSPPLMATLNGALRWYGGPDADRRGGDRGEHSQ